tara:strand:- start:1182 stop:1871 length:690 start_codon:yes stop_codon:yes gene_type:complete
MFNNRNEDPVQMMSRSSASSLIASNTVLKNTYMLLALTLMFSAVTAWFAMASGVGFINPFLFLIIAMGLQFLIYSTANSAFGLVAVFLFTGFMGFTLGPLLNTVISNFANGPELIMTALGGTGLIFFALSGYVLTTRKDMSFLSGMLFAASIVGLIAILASLFFQLPALHLAISALFMLISSGLILYQTSEIIHGGETNYIRATLTLYVSIYNLFISLLQILMAFNRDE